MRPACFPTTVLAVVLGLSLCASSGFGSTARIAPASATGQHQDEDVDLEEALHGIELAMEALERMGRKRELKMLVRVADGLRERLAHRAAQTREGNRERGDQNERRVAINQIEVIQAALPALREAERRDMVDLLEHSIKRRKLDLEGIRNEKANAVRERAPSREQEIKFLITAAELWHEFGHPDKGEVLLKNVDQLWSRKQRERREPTDSEGFQRDRKIFRLAMAALLEADREDLAHLIEHALHARELAHEGRNDDEAHRIRETAPGIGNQFEILTHASRLFLEWGHEEDGHAVANLAERIAAESKRSRAARGTDLEPDQSAATDAVNALRDHARKLEFQIQRLQEQMMHLQKQLEEIQPAERRRRRSI